MTDFAPFRSQEAKETYLLRHQERSRAWPEPWTERMVATSWGETYVRESGLPGAPPLVMLPGIGSPSYSLEPQARDFSAHFRLYAVDNIWDVGRSVCSRQVKDAGDFSEWLNGLFDALELSRPNLLGLSYGGWVFTQYALRHPERVGKLVLLAPAGTVEPINFAFVWRALLALLPWKGFLHGFIDWAAPEMARDPRWASARKAMIEDAALGTRCFARRKMVPPLPPSDEEWWKLAVPALLLFGDQEVIFDPKATAEKMSRVAPQVKLEVLPGVSHDFFVVAAGEVNRRALEFLASS